MFNEKTSDGIGPGPGIAIDDFYGKNPGFSGGGVIYSRTEALPIAFANVRPPGAPMWGKAHKKFQRDYFRRQVRLWVPGEARPRFENRVDVSPTVRDAWGIPVSRITHSLHPNDYQLYEFFRGKMVDLLKESGAIEVISRPAGKGGVDAHQCGTCRLGNDPKTSVVNRYGQVHDVNNLFVVDGSLLVTAGREEPRAHHSGARVLGLRLHRAPVEGWKLWREKGLNTTLSRRGFIFLLSALPFAPKAGLTQWVSTGGDQNPLCDDVDRRVLGSLCEQIFPKDEFPGAIELGVPGFIERCLREGHADWTGIYQLGSAQQRPPAAASIKRRFSNYLSTNRRDCWKECRPAIAENGLAFSRGERFLPHDSRPHPARCL